MKKILFALIFSSFVLSLSGCAQAGGKSTSISALYCISAVISLLVFLGYLFLIKKKERWFVILFASVLIINTSYFCLSISGTLAGALNANRVAYLGSVFLPLSMMMIILKVCNQKYPKWLPAALAFVAVGVFLIAASPGILDIYYKEVYLDTSGGFTTLRKVTAAGILFFLYIFSDTLRQWLPS